MIHWIGNATTLGPPKWYPEPEQRGTFSVLMSCVTTLVLCTWTAVHLQVPRHGHEGRQIWHRLRWLVAGLIAPEYILWAAWEQRCDVKKLTESMRSIYLNPRPSQVVDSGSRSNNSSTRARKRIARPSLLWLCGGWSKNGQEKSFWTDEHSWLVRTGGIVFDISATEQPFFPEGATRLTLTGDGLLILYGLMPQLLPRISTQDVRVKGRADSLAKLLTCAQALWFCIQCITRLSYGLPIALLELTVFGHALCCLLTYGIWWQKPKDVSDPYRITSPEAYGLAAWMCNYSSIGRQATPSRWRDEYHHAWWHPGSLGGIPVQPGADIDQSFPTAQLREHGLLVGQQVWTLKDKRGSPVSEEAFLPDMLTIDRYTMRRIALVGATPAGWDIPRGKVNSVRFSLPVLGTFDDYEKSGLHGLLAAGLLYGGLHLVAWNAGFPYSWEQLVWRIACIVVMAAGPIIYAVLFWYDKLGESTIENCLALGILLLIACLLIFYIFCRGYLIVICFLNLAYLQPDMLKLPAWSLYIPHLS